MRAKVAHRVSVILPTYNRSHLICEALDSVLRQTYRDREIIVVDDGSGDGTVARLEAYRDSITLVSQPRLGVAAARNRGVSWSTGDYLAFLDSDDLWHPEKLVTQVAFMETRSGVEVCQTEESWIRRGARVNPRHRHRKPSGDVFRASLELCLISPSAVMMTRALFDRVGGFDESLPVCEDYDLWLRIAKDTSVELIPEPLVTKRGGHADQLSRATWGLDRFRAASLVKLLRAGLDPEKAKWTLEVLAKKVTILAQGARKRGKEAEALVYERLVTSALEGHERAGEDFNLRPEARG